MSIRIGLYDFFSYTIPGIFYLMLAAFVLVTFGLIDIEGSTFVDLSLFSFVILLGAGYVTGLLLDPVTYIWVRLFVPSRKDLLELNFNEFSQDHSWLAEQFMPQDWPIMLYAIQSKSVDTAMDIVQNNAIRIMFRNISFGLFLLSVSFVLIFFLLNPSPWNLLLAALSIVLSIIAMRKYKARGRWFYKGIYQAYAANFILPEGQLRETKSIAASDEQDNTNTKANNELGNN